MSPNPLVGAVLVRDDELIGEGLPRRAWEACTPSGRRWRTAVLAGEDPAGAAMYVTLEPCAHQGRQPPCAEAILAAAVGAGRDRLR